MKLTLEKAKKMMEKNGGYTIRECIEITKGQYNAEAFERFFEED